MINRVTAARLLFSLNAVLGILAIGGACLFGASYNPHASLMRILLTTFLPLSALWMSICYCAYKGLAGENVVLKSVFWFYVVLNVFFFPVGTAIAAASVWLWRDSRKQDARQVSA